MSSAIGVDGEVDGADEEDAARAPRASTPIAHASIDDRSGRAPCKAASGRSSTAARIAIPARVWYSR